MTAFWLSCWPATPPSNNVCWGLRPHCGQSGPGAAVVSVWAPALSDARTRTPARIHKLRALLLQCTFSISLPPRSWNVWNFYQAMVKGFSRTKEHLLRAESHDLDGAGSCGLPHLLLLRPKLWAQTGTKGYPLQQLCSLKNANCSEFRNLAQGIGSMRQKIAISAFQNGNGRLFIMSGKRLRYRFCHADTVLVVRSEPGEQSLLEFLVRGRPRHGVTGGA